MRNLNDIRGEEAIDVLVDIIEPISRIMDDDLRRMVKEEHADNMAIIKHILKAHKADIIECIAIVEGVPVAECNVNVFTLPKILLDLFNNKEFAELFGSAVQNGGENGSAESASN